jgi:hypothetical protein
MMTIIDVLLVVLIWLMFSLLYFSKEITNLLSGKNKKLHVSNDTGVDQVAIFGGSKTDTALFFAPCDENNNNIDCRKDDYNKNIATFAEENEEGEVNKQSDFEDSYFEDLTNMFDLEFNNLNEFDSDDAINAEGNIEVVKTLGELHKETLNVLKVITGGDGEDVSKEEKLQAGKTLNELQGTDLFSQIESVSGTSKVELMRQALNKLWDEEFEKGDKG